MAIVVEHFSRTYVTQGGTFTAVAPPSFRERHPAQGGTFPAVADLSFEVGPGEIVGLIGPNGAGKTTTLRSLAGILRPTSGRLRIDDYDLIEQPLDARRRLA